MCVFVVLDWLLSAAMTLHCRMVCRFPLGVFKLRVDMTSKALLGGSESADFVRSMWKRCCLSHFKNIHISTRALPVDLDIQRGSNLDCSGTKCDDSRLLLIFFLSSQQN